MNIQEMIARQQAIVDGARNEGRGLTREEQAEFDQLQGKIDAARNAGGQDGNQGGGEHPAEGNSGAGDPGGADGEGRENGYNKHGSHRGPSGRYGVRL